MKHVNKENRKRPSAVQIIRAVIQLAAFILVPGLFISIFSGVGSIYTAIITGTFVFSEQAGNILLAAAAFLITALWGRFFCGFICSFGAMQDLLWQVGKRFIHKPLVSERVDRVLKYLKYLVLMFIVIGVWTPGIGSETVWSPWTVFGMYASPWKGIPTELMFLSVGGALMLIIIVGSVFVERFFCKYLCPLGALFSLTSRFRLFRIKKPSSACGNCRMCARQCSMAIPMYRYDEIRSGECIDCMRCTEACRRDNVKASAIPAVSGSLAAGALAGVTFMGNIAKTDTPVIPNEPAAVVSTEAVGKYNDGVYQGIARGYRGTIEVAVTVSSGMITDITVESGHDDREYLNMAASRIIPAIIEQQDTDVDTVSGATYSSRGIIEAVEDALNIQLVSDSTDSTAPEPTAAPAEAPTEAPTDEETEVPADVQYEEDDEEYDDSGYGYNQSGLTDGVYYGSGSGFRGTTQVAVTVENGMITDITVTSYQDDYQFFSKAQNGVISAIISQQGVDVSTVSGATFSSNSIKEAVASALGLSFTNPNSSIQGGRRH